MSTRHHSRRPRAFFARRPAFTLTSLALLALVACQATPGRERAAAGTSDHVSQAASSAAGAAVSPTRIVVRPQAHGGKFIGDDIGGAMVTIRDAQTGVLLAEGMTHGGSGQLESSYARDASLTAIATPGAPLRWVHAVAGTSAFHAELPLVRPTLLEISALGPLAGLQNAHRTTVLEWVTPGQDLASDAGVVVVIPGLLVQVLAPATHTKFTRDSNVVEIAANVTMMCGCPIDTGGPWPAQDFKVLARVKNLGTGEIDELELPYTGETSRFVGRHEVTGDGNYVVTIQAQQRSVRNGGVGQVSFIIDAAGQ